MMLLDKAKAEAVVEHTVAVNKEFKERAGFNRRRGAMRRRVHQVSFHLSIPRIPPYEVKKIP